MNSMCSACNSIPKIDSFRLKLQRQSDSRGDFNETDTSKTNFIHLPKILGQVVDHREYTITEPEHMNWDQKCRLIQSDPVTRARLLII